MKKPGFAIQTYLGNYFDPKTCMVNNIEIEDIAHALSNLCRYAGHCRKFYSVAEHSVLTHDIAKELWPDNLDVQWAALLHDATEAYVGDVPTPLKVMLPKFEEIETSVALQIAAEFDIDVSSSMNKLVKIVDIAALATEAPFFFEDVSHWDVIRDVDIFPELRVKKQRTLRPDEAYAVFLQTFFSLKRRREQWKQTQANSNL